LLPYHSHNEKISQIKNGSLDLVENVKNFLSQIENKKHLNCYLDIFAEEAIKNAQLISEKIKFGNAGKLAGMVIAVKDLLSIRGKRMTCGSKFLENFYPIYTATCIQKLINEDAIIIGKTNLDEFAMGSSNENSAYGIVKNPANEEYVPGGSSGGSAAAVAAFLCDASIGTDTGGSIRQPAAFCGVYGLKPTYGRVSRYGLTAFASSFDTIGAFARTTYDVALLMEVLSGYDEMDSTCVNRDVDHYSEEIKSYKKFKIGVTSSILNEAYSIEIKSKLLSTIDKIKLLGHEIVYIDLPHSEYAIAAYYILTTAEASSNLARFDGARYGERSDESNDLSDMYINSRSEGFGAEVKRRIMLGTYVLSSGYYDAYYLKAQKVRRIIKNDFDDCFKEVDAIIIPTTPTPPFKIGEKTENPLDMYLSDIFTTTANLAGIPGISIPVGNSQNGLPIGIQILANQFDESILLQLSRQIETCNYL
jgi:aspartyl-tRNA(Asn)/glutamyl-tRNA(Gln) amidotransferase subunit A